MPAAFTFQARPGREEEFERLLNNPEGGKAVAKLMGAARNTLFLGRGRMIRILEFPEGVKPQPMSELAKESPELATFLQKIAPLIQDGFNPDDPSSIEEFNKRAMVPVCYDVRP